MTAAHVALLVCPASGTGAAARIAGTTADRLRAACGQLDLLVSDSMEGITELATKAVRADVDVLVVLGGDGAVHGAVQACARSSTALTVVPSGTGNDFARAMGMPTDPLAAVDQVADALRTGRRRRIDLGRVAGGRWFATVLCAGFDSSVNERVNRMRWPRGARRYDLAIVAELASLGSRRLVVATEDGVLETAAILIAVGNTDRYGGGIPICPNADPTDGLFDLTVVGEVGRGALVRILPSLRSGRHVRHPAVTTLRARSVQLEGGDGWVGYADGERQGALPMTLTCVPGALTVLPPA